MQPIDERAQASEQATAFLALAEMTLHPSAPTRRELPIEIVGHVLRRPPVVALEPHRVHELGHLACDPVTIRTGSHTTLQTLGDLDERGISVGG